MTCPAGDTRRSPPGRTSSSAPPAAPARCATVHHLQDRPHAHPAPRATTCCAPPARTGPLTRAARGLQHTGPTWNAPRPGRHLARAAASSSATAADQEPRLAQAPHRRAEPAQPGRQGPDPPRRRLGAGHLTGHLQRNPAQPGQASPAARTGRPCGPSESSEIIAGPAAERRPGSGAGLKAPARASGKQAIQQAPSRGAAARRSGGPRAPAVSSPPPISDRPM